MMVCVLLTGCAALAAGLASVGAGFGVGNYVSGTNYRTFTEPLAKVRIATLTALRRMEIKVSSTQKTKVGEILKASAYNLRIEVELEAITPNATRMRSVAKRSLLLDQATGLEIVVQTEKALNGFVTPADRSGAAISLPPSHRLPPTAAAED
jgi:hypothetical protein